MREDLEERIVDVRSRLDLCDTQREVERDFRPSRRDAPRLGEPSKRLRPLPCALCAKEGLPPFAEIMVAKGERALELGAGVFGFEIRPDREHERGDERRRDRRDERDRGAVAASELGDAVAERRSSREHGLPAQIALEIGAELRDRWIAPVGIAFEGSRDDVLEIAPKLATERRDAR